MNKSIKWKEILVEGKPCGNWELTHNGYWLAGVWKSDIHVGKFQAFRISSKPQSNVDLIADTAEELMPIVDAELEKFFEEMTND